MEFRRIALTTRQATGWTEVCLKSGMKALVLVESMRSVSSSEHIYVPEGCPLTKRELQVVECLSYGMSNIEIGQKLSLSSLTIKSHLARVAREVGTGNRAGIVSIALQGGWIE